ncbi:protein unc-93 homolog A-like [Sycon ciliatum]|uniref:protein unc-93 homolog A-like n=1 Tax=Sycon ciliatum TaxID=27933 RepID=UPI0031F6DA0B
MADEEPPILADALGDWFVTLSGKWRSWRSTSNGHQLLQSRGEQENGRSHECSNTTTDGIGNENVSDTCLQRPCRSDHDANSEHNDPSRAHPRRKNGLKVLTAAEKRDARTHARNCFVALISLTSVLTAFFGLQALESSINSDGGLGQACVALTYFPSILSVTFLSPFLIRRLGVQRVFRLSLFSYLPFTAAHFHVIPGVLLSVCGFLGLFNMMLGVSATVLVTCSAIDYAAIYGISPDRVMPRFSSILYVGLVTAYVTGPSISSLVLHNPPRAYGNGSASTYQCHDIDETLVLKQKDRYLLLSIYLVLIVVGILNSFRLRSVSSTAIKARLASATACDQITATLRLIGNIDLLLLIPIFFGSGLQKAYMASDFTSFFITPCLGVAYVGYSIACMGAANLCTTMVLPSVMKHVNRAVLVMGATVVQSSILAFLIFWHRTRSAPLLYSLAVAWGAADATWNISTCVMIGIAFPRDQEAASSNFRVWQGLGLSLGALYSQRIGKCVPQMRIKLGYILMYSVLAALTYAFVELRQRRRHQAQCVRKKQGTTLELARLDNMHTDA